MKDINNWQAQFESCQYSDRLINKLLLLNKKVKIPVDIQKVKKAIYYAKKYHGSQVRESGGPYYSHPIEVAYMVSDYLFKTDAIIVSILHDTIEDTELTFSMIEEIFGETVAYQVMDLTRIKEDGHKISSAEMIDILFKQKKYEILLIKQFDRLHNMQTVGIKSPEKTKMIVEDTLVNFMTVAIYLGLSKIEQLLSQLCSYDFIQNGILPAQNQTFSFNYSVRLPPLIPQNDVIHKQILCRAEPL